MVNRVGLMITEAVDFRLKDSFAARHTRFRIAPQYQITNYEPHDSQIRYQSHAGRHEIYTSLDMTGRIVDLITYGYYGRKATSASTLYNRYHNFSLVFYIDDLCTRLLYIFQAPSDFSRSTRLPNCYPCIFGKGDTMKTVV